ncbi:hypothetical protein HMPREF1584_00827 [Gardnerella vaginalis JCP8481A]|nr:hypothetical protein HMPREF1584_00827 [Gardnerella vaginalis JCP8481A]EPI42764.1 hypothetical protein HMPREF1585_00713 [Gardnerella vaginalis JCP8481B]
MKRNKTASWRVSMKWMLIACCYLLLLAANCIFSLCIPNKVRNNDEEEYYCKASCCFAKVC